MPRQIQGGGVGKETGLRPQAAVPRLLPPPSEESRAYLCSLSWPRVCGWETGPPSAPTRSGRGRTRSPSEGGVECGRHTAGTVPPGLPWLRPPLSLPGPLPRAWFRRRGAPRSLCSCSRWHFKPCTHVPDSEGGTRPSRMSRSFLPSPRLRETPRLSKQPGLPHPPSLTN